METSENTSMLMEMADSFMGEMDRCGRVKSETGRMTPPEKPEAMKLENCRAAVHELDLTEVLMKKLLEEEEEFIDKADLKKFINRYCSGAKICLGVVAFGKDGMPMTKKDLDQNKHFKRMEVRHDGLTYNTGLDAGYYYSLLPEEIQKDISEGGCTFTVPYYEHFAYPSKPETAAVKKAFRRAFENLKALIDKIPEFEEAA